MSGLRSNKSEGNPAGTTGGVLARGAFSRLNVGCGLADQNRNRMLKLRSLDAEINRLCPRCLKLRLGLRHIYLGSNATVVAVLC